MVDRFIDVWAFCAGIVVCLNLYLWITKQTEPKAWEAIISIMLSPLAVLMITIVIVGDVYYNIKWYIMTGKWMFKK